MYCGNDMRGQGSSVPQVRGAQSNEAINKFNLDKAINKFKLSTKDCHRNPTNSLTAYFVCKLKSLIKKQSLIRLGM